MRLHRHLLHRRAAIAAGLTLALGAVTGVAVAGTLEPDGVNLKGNWANGGALELELEDRNTQPVICFIWENQAPDDGDSFTSRILTRAGVEVVDLGTSDQWIAGAGEGCEIPVDDAYEDVFANPSAYVVEVRVVEEQGTAPTTPLFSTPLQRA